MEKISLNEIKSQIESLAKKINISEGLLPTYGFSIGTGQAHVEIDSKGLFHYVIAERGTETTRKIFTKIDDLLYEVFSDITLTTASQYELKNRIKGQDSRRIMFWKQEEILGSLNERWKERRRGEKQLLLMDYPYDDNAGLRADYVGQLKKEGLSYDDAFKKAKIEFPPITKDNLYYG